MSKSIAEPTLRFLDQLRSRELAPKNIELSKIGDSYIANCYQQTSNDVISEEVYAGIHKNLDISVLKTISEYVERKVMRESREPSRDHGTDGCAAFPALNGIGEARQRARQNAFNEAVERYTWAQWWDKDFGADIKRFTTIEFLDLFKNSSPFVGKVSQLLNVNEWIVIQPKVNYDTSSLILFGRRGDGGYVCGGACEISRDDACARALSEMLRHALAISRLEASGGNPSHPYEKRILFFASGKGDELVSRRLSRLNGPVQSLPALAIDREIAHNDSDLVVVHRCLFDGQPLFLGGPLERFCI